MDSLRECLAATPPASSRSWRRLLGAQAERVRRPEHGSLRGRRPRGDPAGSPWWPAPCTSSSSPAPGAADGVAFPACSCCAGAGSEATLVETYAGLPGASRLTCAVTEVARGRERVAPPLQAAGRSRRRPSTSRPSARASSATPASTTSRSRWAPRSRRHDLDVDFAARGRRSRPSRASSSPTASATPTPTPSSTTPGPTARAASSTRASWTAGGEGSSTARSMVRAGAQKTDAAQTNKNLLLSREALVHSIPQLEILADDVKCRHGATTGQLDEDAALLPPLARPLRSGRPRPPHRGLRGRSRPPHRPARPPRARLRASAGEAARGGRSPRRPPYDHLRPRPAAPTTWRKVRADFPILRETVHGKPLVYLDSAASGQKPQAVIDAERAVYEHAYSNVHRGVHTLSMKATDLYEGARAKVRDFMGARDVKEIVFVRGHHRGHQPRGPELRPPARGRGRRGADLRPRAPLEHRALADALRGEGGAARGGAHRRRRGDRDGGAREAPLAPHEDRGGRPTCRTPSAPSTP